MSTTAERMRLAGIVLPARGAPAANYVPFRVVGSLLFVSGQVPLVDGRVRHIGKVGQDLTIEDGYAAARICALNLLAHAAAACDGDLDRVRAVARIAGYVNSTPDFTAHPKVVDGASDLVMQVFGDRGAHARVAVGTASLPRGAAVEVEGLFELAL